MALFKALHNAFWAKIRPFLFNHFSFICPSQKNNGGGRWGQIPYCHTWPILESQLSSNSCNLNLQDQRFGPKWHYDHSYTNKKLELGYLERCHNQYINFKGFRLHYFFVFFLQFNCQGRGLLPFSKN